MAYNPYVPTPHQVEDSDALLEYQHGYLWADAGTGKTVTAMEAFRKGHHTKLIVLCPKMALSMWKTELQRHLLSKARPGKPFYARILNTGKVMPSRKNPLTGKKQGVSFMDADAIITTFDLFPKLKEHLRSFVMGHNRKMDQRYPTALILDEAHMIKSRDAKRTKELFHVTSIARIADPYVEDIWQLTGTPVMRYYDDLYTQLKLGRSDILTHYKVDTYEKFVNEFCDIKYVKYGRMQHPKKTVSGNRNAKKLQQVLSSCQVIRRKLTDVVDDLPDITHRNFDASYKNVPKVNVDADTLIGELNKPDSELSKTRRLLGVAKVPDIVAYIREYGQRPLLVGFWHKDVCSALVEEIATPLLNIAVVDGSTSQNERDLIRERFNAGDIDYLFGQMQAMNTSWNLQESCSHVIVAEELPSPGLLHQFYSRVYRRGQKRHVQVDYATSAHDIDIALRNIRETKALGNERADL